MFSENNKSILILIFKNSISNYVTYRKNSLLFILGRINISIAKLIVISGELICNRYFINVTNNSKCLI